MTRLQSFPDDFIFEGKKSKQLTQIGNAVPPRLGYEIAKSVFNALDGIEQICTVNHNQHNNINKETVLVGYYKGDVHKQLILRNQLYYVRSDGRKGSMFKNECSVMPQYLLLHYKGDAEIYELNAEEPVLADASFLKTLGFSTTGKTYLCFQLKSAKPIVFCDIVDHFASLHFDTSNYDPYFTTIKEILE